MTLSMKQEIPYKKAPRKAGTGVKMFEDIEEIKRLIKQITLLSKETAKNARTARRCMWIAILLSFISVCRLLFSVLSFISAI